MISSDIPRTTTLELSLRLNVLHDMAQQSPPMLDTLQNNNLIAKLYSESHSKPKYLKIQQHLSCSLMNYDLFARGQKDDVREEES